MKIALLGCGGFARRHANGIRNTDSSIEIVAVSRSLETARQFAAEYNAIAVAPYQAALEDPTIDAVTILLPHDQHIEIAVEALQRGKHVYLEKPVARTVAEAAPLGEAHARYPDRVLMIGENYQFLKPIEVGAAMVAEGKIGQLQMVLFASCHLSSPRTWRKLREPMGGGAMIDGGVHNIHGLRMLGGEIESVMAFEPAVKSGIIEGEAAVQVVYRYAGGASGSLTYSWETPGNPPLPEFTVMGTAGSLQIFLREQKVVYYPMQGEPETTPAQDSPDCITRMFGSFVTAIRGEAPVAVDLASGLTDVAVVEAVYASLKCGQVTPVAPLPAWAALK